MRVVSIKPSAGWTHSTKSGVATCRFYRGPACLSSARPMTLPGVLERTAPGAIVPRAGATGSLPIRHPRLLAEANGDGLRLSGLAVDARHLSPLFGIHENDAVRARGRRDAQFWRSADRSAVEDDI